MRLQELIEKLQTLPSSAQTARVDVVTSYSGGRDYRVPNIMTPLTVRYEAGTVFIDLVARQ